MKCLTLSNLFFKLPDDFDGNIGDAFRLLGEYCNTETEPVENSLAPKTEKELDELKKMSHEDSHRHFWAIFLETVGNGGRVDGLTASISELNTEKNDMDNLERGLRYKVDGK